MTAIDVLILVFALFVIIIGGTKLALSGGEKNILHFWEFPEGLYTVWLRFLECHHSRADY